jgi:DNA-binding NarL/FixJ family response regulator
VQENLAARRPLLVVGPPGIGKTVLMLAGARARGASVLVGGGLSTLADLPYLALARALRRDLPPAGPSEVARVVADAVGHRTLVVDDLQWADPQTLAVLTLLARELPLLAGMRTGPRLTAARATLAPPFGVLALGRLDRRSGRLLLEAERPDLGDAEAERIVTRAAGDPSLLRELAHPPVQPSALRLALTSRTQSLSAPAQAALQRLALLGRPGGPQVAGRGVRELVECGLAQPTPGGLTLRHDLLGEVVRSRLDSATRRATHAALARGTDDPGEAARHYEAAGERAEARRTAMLAVSRTDHLGERAGLLAVAALNDAGPQADRLRLRAAQELVDVGDFPLSVRVAAAVSFRAPGMRAQAEALLAHVHAELGDVERAHGHVANGLELIGSGTPLVRGRLLLERARLRSLDGDPQAIEDAERGVWLVERAGRVDPAARIVLSSVLRRRRLPGHIAHARAARREAGRRGERSLELEACAAELGGLAATGRPVAARRLARDGQARAEALGLGRRADELRALRAHLELHQRGDHHAALTLQDGLLGSVLGHRLYPAFLDRVLALADLGREAEAEALVRGRLKGARTREGNTVEALARAELEWMTGRPKRAARHARAGLELAAGGPFADRLTWVLGWACLDLAVAAEPSAVDGEGVRGLGAHLAAVAATADKRPAEAEALFARAADEVAGRSFREELRCRWAAAEAALAVGETTRARTALLDLDARMVAHGLVPMRGRVRRSLRRAGVRATPPTPVGTAGPLSPREHEVLGLVAEGLSSERIAARLGVTRATVETQVRTAMTKLGARTRTQAAVRVAAKAGA